MLLYKFFDFIIIIIYIFSSIYIKSIINVILLTRNTIFEGLLQARIRLGEVKAQQNKGVSPDLQLRTWKWISFLIK